MFQNERQHLQFRLVGEPLCRSVFENIKRQISELDVYDAKLIFEKAGTIKIEIMVHPHGHTSRLPILALAPSLPILLR
jgi:hypothetical protein